jgi:chromosome segregation ATPase
MRITQEQRGQIEERIRAAMDRLLRGDIPPGAKCDVKTLANESGVSRAAIYSTYLHLKEEFEHRRDQLGESSGSTDPREAQIARLKHQVGQLRSRIEKRDEELEQLKGFRVVALSRLAAQHDEITRLRATVSNRGNVQGVRVSDSRGYRGP